MDYVPSMTAHSTRARRHGLAAFGVTATLLVALASTASATTPPDSTTPAEGSTAPADSAGGDASADLEALYAGGPRGGTGQPHRPARQLGELRRHPAVVPRQVPGHRQPGAEPRRLVGRRAHRRRDPARLGHDARLARRRPAVRPAGGRRGHLGPVHADDVGRDPRHPEGPGRQLGRRVLRDHVARHQHDARRERADVVRRPQRPAVRRARCRSTATRARPVPPSPR